MKIEINTPFLEAGHYLRHVLQTVFFHSQLISNWLFCLLEFIFMLFSLDALINFKNQPLFTSNFKIKDCDCLPRIKKF